MSCRILLINKDILHGAQYPKSEEHIDIMIASRKQYTKLLIEERPDIRDTRIPLFWYFTILHEMGHQYYNHEEAGNNRYEAEADSFIYQCIKKEHWSKVDNYLLDYFKRNSFIVARIKVSREIAEQEEIIITHYKEQKVA